MPLGFDLKAGHRYVHLHPLMQKFVVLHYAGVTYRFLALQRG